jgi:hypothetical protein
MAHYEVTISSPLSQQEAFDRVAAVERFAEWDAGVSSSEQIEGDAPGEGSVYLLKVKGFTGGDLPLKYETTAFDSPNRFVIISDGKTLRSDDVITVVPDGDGCQVTYAADLKMKGAFALINPALGLVFNRIGDKAVAGLRPFLDA